MKLLVEGYKYRSDAVKGALKGIEYFESINHEVVVRYVGYLYNPHIGDCVFILPKVLLDDKNLVFGKDPHDLINMDQEGLGLDDAQRGFIYEFAVWIYRTIYVFNQTHPDNEIVLHKRNTTIGADHRHMANTFLEVIMALVDFNRKNQDFFMQIVKNQHSGFNKINWNRTISTSTAIIQNQHPVYLNPVNKKRQINFDEELLILFFSILNHVNAKYGFPVRIPLGFELIKGEQFQRYLDGFGEVRLRQIKYKYFSDKALYLWELCHAFFQHSHNVSIASEMNEYLIASDFEIVFEGIIDDLIGDPEAALPKNLKNQRDGKRVDHLYKDDALTVYGEPNTDAKKIFYIGDSKYYQLLNEIPDDSVYKQYTYARNLIQWNMDIFRNPKPDELHWQQEIEKSIDMKTEGYNIVPNFFISARMAPNLSYDDNIFETAKRVKTHMQCHFENRLFDRDTLLISHYDVNFLYIISLYSRDNDAEKAEWKTKVRAMFREQIRNMLQARFSFYAMKPKRIGEAETFLKENFQDVLGKVSRPYLDEQCYSLALEQYVDEPDDSETVKATKAEKRAANDALRYRLEEVFYVESIKLGENPTEKLAQYSILPSYITKRESKKGVLMVMMENYKDRHKFFLGSGVIAIGLKDSEDSQLIIDNLSSIGYLLFHTRKDEGQHLFSVMQVSRPMLLSEIGEVYPNVKTGIKYIIVNFNNDFELMANNIHSKLISYNPKTRYDSQYTTIDLLAGS
ncbi:MAG: LlaJI family restriction endonuclease [Bacteroidales bacterium]|nr:LlaJI family restriction endonuclease [Bacteroidales bacterium]